MGDANVPLPGSFASTPGLACKRREGLGTKTAAGARAGAYVAAGAAAALGAESATGATKGLATGAGGFGVSVSLGATVALFSGAGVGSGRLLITEGKIECEEHGTQPFSTRSGFIENVGELARIYGFEVLIATFEFFEGLDGCLGHAFVGLGGATYENEFIAGGEAFMTVGIIQADPE